MVSYVGLTQLNLPTTEERHTRAVAERHLHRIQTLADDIIDARVRIKSVRKGGIAARYEVSVAVLTNEGPRYATSASWRLSTAVHNAFESVEHQLAARKDHARHYGGHREVWNYPEPLF